MSGNEILKQKLQKWAQKKGRRTARQPFIRLFQQDRYLADFFPPLADFFDALAINHPNRSALNLSAKRVSASIRVRGVGRIADRFKAATWHSKRARP